MLVLLFGHDDCFKSHITLRSLFEHVFQYIINSFNLNFNDLTFIVTIEEEIISILCEFMHSQMYVYLFH